MNKLFNYGRIFYHWRIDQTSKLPHEPEDISVELTNTCNFRCAFCPQSDPEHFNIVTRSTLAPNQARILVEKLRRGGVQTNVLLWTLDGEPFVNKEIGEICVIAMEHGFDEFIFSTNGFFCTEDRLNELPQDANYQLCVDFCANEALFEKHRGTRNSWGKVKANLEALLVNERLSHIRLKVTDITSFDPDAVPTNTDSVSALRNLFAASPRLNVASRVFHNATGHVPGLKEKKREKANKYNLCPYPWTSMVIASNGDVVACCRDLQHKTVLGNLFEQELVDIWNSEEYQNLRTALVEKDPDRMSACQGRDLPYDADKFRVAHLAKTAVNRLGILR